MPEQSGWQLSQCLVRAFLVVDRDPFIGGVTDLIQVFKQISIEDLRPIRSFKAPGKSVLARLTGLDKTLN